MMAITILSCPTSKAVRRDPSPSGHTACVQKEHRMQDLTGRTEKEKWRSSGRNSDNKIGGVDLLYGFVKFLGRSLHSSHISLGLAELQDLGNQFALYKCHIEHEDRIVLHGFRSLKRRMSAVDHSPECELTFFAYSNEFLRLSKALSGSILLSFLPLAYHTLPRQLRILGSRT